MSSKNTFNTFGSKNPYSDIDSYHEFNNRFYLFTHWNGRDAVDCGEKFLMFSLLSQTRWEAKMFTEEAKNDFHLFGKEIDKIREYNLSLDNYIFNNEVNGWFQLREQYEHTRDTSYIK